MTLHLCPTVAAFGGDIYARMKTPFTLAQISLGEEDPKTFWGTVFPTNAKPRGSAPFRLLRGMTCA